MGEPTILRLREASGSSSSLKDQLVVGLRDGQPSVQPDSDSSFVYTRSISTQSLYSDQGLSIYAEITALKEYYPFAAELEILSQHGDEIAARMFGSSAEFLQSPTKEDDKTHHDELHFPRPREAMSIKERWGDEASGRQNYGVNGGLNGEAGTKFGAVDLGAGPQVSTIGHEAGTKVGTVVELGAGSLTKTRHLLRSLAKVLRSPAGFDAIEYKALDLEHKSLVFSLTELEQAEADSVAFESANQDTPRVRVSGICATYDQGLAYLQHGATPASYGSDSDAGSSEEPTRVDRSLSESSTSASDGTAFSSQGMTSSPSSSTSGLSASKSLLWLGSSIGNLTREEAADFLKNISDNVLNVGDTMVIGIDNCQDGAKIVEAYNDPSKVTERFILEGVTQSRIALGGGEGQGMKVENFEYVNRWNASLGRHEAYLRCKSDIVIEMPVTTDKAAHQVHLEKGELINIEFSYKYTEMQARSVFNAAGLRLVQSWTDSRRVHSVYLLEKAPFFLPSTLDSPVNAFGAPTIEEWNTLWKAWDTVILEIIPKQMLLKKPIDLRNPPLFYAGHLPTFADIHLSAHFDEPLTEPAYFAQIFERGIDPDVNDPSKINHSHSIVPAKPEDWPTLDEVIAYSHRVRERVIAVYDKPLSRRTARVLAMLIEHDGLHLETSLYIALQASSELQQPIGWSVPDFASLAQGWNAGVEADGTARKMILDFPTSTIEIGQNDDDKDLEAFDAAHSFGWDCENPKRAVQVQAFQIDALPISNVDYYTFLMQLDTPRPELFLSSWSGSMEKIEIKTIYGLVSFAVGQHWPATASAVQFDAYAKSQNARLPTESELRVYLETNPVDTPASNIGFANFHPVPPTLPTLQQDGHLGCGSNGGVWEWTTTLLGPHEGYSPSILYPGYSSDFHDEAHQIILGGSYMTQPRIAGRKSFVNWYQSGYPYVVAGARLVRS